ncbi:MAG: ABC transporter permease [Anaerolineae bacterium]|nr:ABC transporter permease [Anaerolineae bacterium]
MAKFIARRLIQSIPVFFGITLLSYLIMVLAPGDPVSIMTFDPTMSQEERAALADRLGVNDPWPVQYFRWLVGNDWMVVDEVTWYQVEMEDGATGWLSEKQMAYHEETGDPVLLASRQPYRDEPKENAEITGRIGRNAEFTVITETVEDVKGDSRGILRGDFGKSFTHHRNPLDLIGERIGASIELNIAVILVGLAIGLPVGVLAAILRGQAFDQGSRVLAVLGDAIPIFWLAHMVLLIFGAPNLDWLPMGGRCDHIRGGCGPVYTRLEYLILPTAVSALGVISGWSRYIRASMLEAISSDYIRTAQAKGLTARQVWFTHGLRNALIPVATFLGPTIVSLVSGSVIIETIFSWPGWGRLTLQAVSAQDYPLIMASVVIGAVLTIIGYLISDILYAVFDPRIRLS